MLDAFTYPHPRHRKGEPSQPQVPTGNMPVTRYFTGRFAVQDQRRWTWSGPRLTGPAMLQSFDWYTQGHSSGLDQVFELGYALEPVNENAVARTLPRTWTTLTELRLNNVAPMAPPTFGFPDVTQPSVFVRWSERVELIVEQPFFYPVVSYQQQLGSIQPYTWSLRVTEQIDRRRLQLFRFAGQWPASRTNPTTPDCATSRCSPAPDRSSPCSTRPRRPRRRTPGTGSATHHRSRSRKVRPDLRVPAAFTSLPPRTRTATSAS